MAQKTYKLNISFMWYSRSRKKGEHIVLYCIHNHVGTIKLPHSTVLSSTFPLDMNGTRVKVVSDWLSDRKREGSSSLGIMKEKAPRIDCIFFWSQLNLLRRFEWNITNFYWPGVHSSSCYVSSPWRQRSRQRTESTGECKSVLFRYDVLMCSTEMSSVVLTELHTKLHLKFTHFNVLAESPSATQCFPHLALNTDRNMLWVGTFIWFCRYWLNLKF